MIGAKGLILLIALNMGPQALASPVSSNCGPAVTAFLSQPTSKTLASLNSRGADCWQVIASSETRLDRLDEWAQHGNRWAAEYLAAHVRQLDGGYLEDALIAIGVFSEHDMQQFLIFANRGVLPERALSDSLVMLPLSMSDDPHGQLKRLKERRQEVLKVSSSRLAPQKAEALKAIDHAESDIRSTTPGFR